MKLFIKILKIFFFLLVTAGLIFLAFWMVNVHQWPIWAGASIPLGALALFIGYIYLKRILIRRHEEKFIKQVISKETEVLKGPEGDSADKIKDLEGKWNQGIDILKRAPKRKGTTPLHSLPWIMVMGAQGSGKTSALRSAALPSPYPESIPVNAPVGTRNIDWWFYEHSIVIDTAGRYTIFEDQERDRGEWEKLLALIIRTKKREPINGVVVCIGADVLLEANTDRIEKYALSMRQRLDDLMRSVGVRYPVYILATKCDLVFGFNDLLNKLTPEFSIQPMGATNENYLSVNPGEFVENLMNETISRLKDARVNFIGSSQTGNVAQSEASRIVMMPSEFAKIQPGLDTFTRSLFRVNPYQETPILRGLYFCSSKQFGSAASTIAASVGIPGTVNELPATNRGYFLKKLFDNLIPSDSGLRLPHRWTVRAKILTKSLGAIAWLAITAAIGGMLTLGYYQNRSVLMEYANVFPTLPKPSEEMNKNLVMMDSFGKLIFKMDEIDRMWWIPKFEMSHGAEAVKRLKRDYCRLYMHIFFYRIDSLSETSVSQVSTESSGQARGAYTVQIVRYLNMLNARLNGKNYDELKKLPQPTSASLSLLDDSIMPDLAMLFPDIYTRYLVFQTDTNELTLQKNNYRAWLEHLVNIKGTGFEWILDWVNQTSNIKPVMLEDFWNGSKGVSEDISVPPCYTTKGKDLVDSFWKEIDLALGSPSYLKDQKIAFEKWYSSGYFESWQEFAKSFSKGEDSLGGVKEWRAVASALPEHSPYFVFLARMANEFKPFDNQKKLPAFVDLVLDLDEGRAQAQAADFVKDAQMLANATTKFLDEGKTLLNKAMGKSDKGMSSETHSIQDHLSSVKSIKEYLDALKETGKTSVSRQLAFKTASLVFGRETAGDPKQPMMDDKQKPAFFTAEDASRNYLAAVAGVGSDETFANLLRGPLNFYLAFISGEASCSLQEQWSDIVLSDTSDAQGWRLQDSLFGQNGTVWKFVNGPASAFVAKNQQGYYPRETMSRSIPFEKSFFTFVNRGRAGKAKVFDSYNVSVKATPIEINQDAKTEPYAAILDLQCADTAQSLRNFNYPEQKVFKWSPKTCGDVSLTIKIGDLTLEKKYTGDKAFARFVSDFKDGSKTFALQDFQESAESLKALNVKFIKVVYKLNGHEAIIDLLQDFGYNVPQNIATCWW